MSKKICTLPTFNYFAYKSQEKLCIWFIISGSLSDLNLQKIKCHMHQHNDNTFNIVRLAFPLHSEFLWRVLSCLYVLSLLRLGGFCSSICKPIPSKHMSLSLIPEHCSQDRRNNGKILSMVCLALPPKDSASSRVNETFLPFAPKTWFVGGELSLPSSWVIGT